MAPNVEKITVQQANIENGEVINSNVIFASEQGLFNLSLIDNPDAKIVNNSPYIKINCRISGRVYSLNENANYSDPQTLEELSNSCSNYLESIISDYLYKTSKVFNSDITKLGKYIRKNFLTESEYKDYMNRIQQRLKEMSEEEKNRWIYHYARVHRVI